MNPIATTIILLAGLGAFAWSIYTRFTLFRVAKGKDNRLNHIGQRILRTLKYAFGQRRFMRKRELKAGIMHMTIFWGFLVIVIRTVTLFGMGFKEDFVFPLMGGVPGVIYSSTLNVFALLICIAVLYGLYRRLFVKPKRLTLGMEGIIILSTIFLLMISDFLFDASHLLLTGHITEGAFVGHALSGLLDSLPAGALKGIESSSYFLHLSLILGFLNFLPYGKHFHIITGIPNVFFMNLKPYGQLTAVNFEDTGITTYGNDHIEQFTPKNYLDWFTCKIGRA